MFASFIMAGRKQAAFFVLLTTLLSLILPPVSIFSGAAIALITLKISWQQGLLYSLIGSVVLATVTYLLKQDASLGFLAGFIGWLPIVLFAAILAQTQSWQSTLQAVLTTAVLGVLLFHAYQVDIISFWQNNLERVKPAIAEAYQLGNEQTDELVKNLSKWMTGVFAALIAISSTLVVLLARHWQAMLYNVGGFGKEFRQLRVGLLPAIVVVFCIIVAILSKNTLAIEILIIAVCIFMLQGVALVHGIVKQQGMKPYWLVGLYVLLFIMLPQMTVLLAAFGIIDNFVDFRRKLATRSD